MDSREGSEGTNIEGPSTSDVQEGLIVDVVRFGKRISVSSMECWIRLTV